MLFTHLLWSMSAAIFLASGIRLWFVADRDPEKECWGKVGNGLFLGGFCLFVLSDIVARLL